MPKALRLTRKLNIPSAPLRSNTGKAVARLIKGEAKQDRISKFSGLLGNDDSKQIQDPFDKGLSVAEGALQTVPYAYPPRELVAAGKQNSTLNQCIEAYVVNIESYGFQLEYAGPQGQEQSALAQSQKNLAISFLDNPSCDRSLRQMREESRWDLEYTGNRYFEIGEDQLGRPTFMEHVPGPTMRMTRRDKKPTPFEVIVKNPEGNGYVTRPASKYFRRYVQIGSGGERVYFKEFGDPRSIDPKTGLENDALAPEERATAIYHHMLYQPGFEYGVPRWIGALPSVLGTRESELVNLNFFRDNAIPAMAVLISGGALTAESFETIESLVKGVRGADAMHKILVLEAASDDSASTTDQAPRSPRSK